MISANSWVYKYHKFIKHLKFYRINADWSLVFSGGNLTSGPPVVAC